MELKDILQIDFKSLEDDGKQTVFGVISTIEPESIPKKHVKKVFEIAQDVLKFKGEEPVDETYAVSGNSAIATTHCSVIGDSGVYLVTRIPNVVGQPSVTGCFHQALPIEKNWKNSKPLIYSVDLHN